MHASRQILVSNTVRYKRKPGLLRGMADFRAARGKYKISLEHFVMPEVKKDSKPMAMSQGQGKGLPLAKY